jgi:flagellar hook-basal body complex protein FliE
MTNSIPITGLTQVAGPTAPTQSPKVAGASGGKDFKSILLDSLNEVNRLQDEADQGVQRLLTGETDNVAEVITAVNKSGVAFDLLMEVRNKLADAYREIQQMRV